MKIESPPPNRENGTRVKLFIPRSSPPEVLAIDDDQMACDLIRKQLSINGYTVHYCKNGAEALEFLKTHLPNIIVTDLVMPVMDGVFQKLHKPSEYAGTGIGLAVCRKIVERHGGTLTAECRQEGGTVFRIVLPRKI
jgi:CheY-like chemotaxis protein